MKVRYVAAIGLGLILSLCVFQYNVSTEGIDGVFDNPPGLDQTELTYRRLGIAMGAFGAFPLFFVVLVATWDLIAWVLRAIFRKRRPVGDAFD